MPIDYLSLGKEIKIARRQRHLTQHELAAVTGLSQSYLALLEQGKRKPSLETLIALSRTLKTPIDALLRASTFRRRPLLRKPAPTAYIFRYERARNARLESLQHTLADRAAKKHQLIALNQLAHQAQTHYRQAHQAMAAYDQRLQQILSDEETPQPKIPL